MDSGVTLQSVSQGSWQPKPKLLDRLREALRSRHYSRRTEQSYSHSVKRFIFFHNVRHPAEMAESEINAFLTHLAVKEKMRRRARPSLRSRWVTPGGPVAPSPAGHSRLGADRAGAPQSAHLGSGGSRSRSGHLNEGRFTCHERDGSAATPFGLLARLR